MAEYSADMEAYWFWRGQTYLQEFRRYNPVLKLRYWDQERQVRAYLRKFKDDKKIDTILEVGCGFGRMTRILREIWPDAEIDAIDVSPEQLRNARKIEPSANYFLFSLFDLDEVDRYYDTVFASEVLLHIPPEKIENALGLCREKAKKAFVHIDWYQDGGSEMVARYCWQHQGAYKGERTVIKNLPWPLRLLKSGQAVTAIYCEEMG